MKKLLFALTITIGLLAPLAPRAQAATDVSLNFFYDNLGSQGNWVEVGDYGYCFQPNVAYNNPDWRPYADGYWAYTDVGWTWVSYEDFGWATYHYGRWSNLADYGWVWVPGYEWGPAWVSWRTGGDYIGWAPLPATSGAVYEGRAINAQVDVDYDIGPEYYNFVDIRYVGEPVLRGRIVQTSENVTIINRTVNVTNITYNNSIVYNYGPSYERVNQYSARPVERLTLSRETTVANLSLQAGGGRNFNRVNGSQLMVVAPAIQRSQQRIAPKTVKTKIEKPTFERGWRGVSNRQQIQAEMKKENAQNVPPPSFQPQKGRRAAAEPVAAAAENQQATPNQPNEANKAARQERQQAGKANAAEANAPETTPNAENAQADQSQREAQRAKRQQKAAQSDSNSNKAQPNETKPNEGDRAARRAARQNRQNASDTSADAPKAEAADQGAQQNAAGSDAARERTKNRRERQLPAADQTPDNSGHKEAAQADQPKADRPPAGQESNPQMDQRGEARQERQAARRSNTESKPTDQPKADRPPAGQEPNPQMDQRREARQERQAARRSNTESKPAEQPEQARPEKARPEQVRPEPRRAEPSSGNNQPEAAPQGRRAEQRNVPQNRPAERAQVPAQEKQGADEADSTPRKPRKKTPNDENKPDQP